MIFSPFDTLFDYLNTHLFSYSHFYFLILSLSQEMICQSCMKALDSRLGSRVQELFIVNLFNFFVSQFIFLSLFFSFSIFDIFWHFNICRVWHPVTLSLPHPIPYWPHQVRTFTSKCLALVLRNFCWINLTKYVLAVLFTHTLFSSLHYSSQHTISLFVLIFSYYYLIFYFPGRVGLGGGPGATPMMTPGSVMGGGGSSGKKEVEEEEE